MIDKYDVAIIGAGIPGLYCARALSSKGLKVIIFDKSKIPGNPNYSTAGIPKYVVDLFNIPQKAINTEVDVMIYATRNRVCRKKADDVFGYVLDFKKTKEIMAKEVEKFGGVVRWDTNIDNVHRDLDDYSLFSNDVEYKSKYVVDASGVSSQIGENMGIEENIKEPVSVGEEYIIYTKSKALDIYKRSMSLILDYVLCPYGYAWIFDNGNDTFKIGVSEFFINPKHNLPSIDDRLEAFLKWLLKDDVYKIVEKHGGGKLITDKYLQLYKDRMLGIGDSISSLNPFWGEGIRQGLYSAEYAVTAIVQDYHDGNGLSGYARQIKKYHDLNWKISMFISKQIYTRPSQRVFEMMVDYMDRYLTAEEVVSIGFYYSFKTLFFKRPLKFFMMALKQFFQ